MGAFDIEVLRQVVAQGRIQWHHHALERLLERVFHVLRL